MSVLWTFRELAGALGLPAVDGPDITGVSIDSRRTAPGDLFIALAGDPGPRFQPSVRSNRDGHDFARDAVAKGAAAVLAHRPGDYGAPMLRVDDTLDALWALGRAARARLSGPVVAVTGSSGKTTFKTFAAGVLDAFATAGSLNNHLGVPLSLALTPRGAAAAVYEIGTNHPGEIEPLSKLAAPDVAVVLNVHPAHIGNFESLDAIAREKLSIAAGIRPGGALVRPPELPGGFKGRTVTFGSKDADVAVVGHRSTAAGAAATLATPGGPVECPVPGGGEHRAFSVGALAAVLIALGCPLESLRRLADGELPAGRGNRRSAGGVALVDDSYNANPASMAASLRAFAAAAATPGGRRVAILGDMLELGQGAARYHAELAPLCANLDGVFCVGAQMRALAERLPQALLWGRADAVGDHFVATCAQTLRAGDQVLVKGSNGVFWVAGFVAKLAAALAARA